MANNHGQANIFGRASIGDEDHPDLPSLRPPSPTLARSRSSLAGTAGGIPLPFPYEFVPGGVAHRSSNSNSEEEEQGTDPPSLSASSTSLWKVQRDLIRQALVADVRLGWYRSTISHSTQHHPRPHQQQKHQQQQLSNDEATPVVPSLSVLAGAAFGRLTGCDPSSAKEYCDAMLTAYLLLPPQPQQQQQITEEQLWNDKFVATHLLCQPVAASGRAYPTAPASTSMSALEYLKMRRPAAARTGRPCGYVFKRGDIAWNCRTCQTDPTCVVCDNCFRNSNHDGHEVYFHRTTPGGCCDCGDIEAWKLDGCCPDHRPDPAQQAQHQQSSAGGGADAGGGLDALEAVRMCAQGYSNGAEAIRTSGLPPLFLAALGAVIGAAVQSVVDAMDGAGIGADPSQWKIRWAEEGAKVRNCCSNNQDYFFADSRPFVSPALYIQLQEPLPEGYKLHLRLHNDDVHTFDEVIDALHEPRRRGGTSAHLDGDSSLVSLRESAVDMTQHVDSDGQVTVRTYSTIHEAMQGFKRLKSRGLHCAVVSSPQVALEMRARNLLQYLAELANAHPAAAALVTHALVHVDPQHALAGVRVWRSPRCIPVWATDRCHRSDEAQACRSRFQAFPPTLDSSYVTFEDAEVLYGFAASLNPAGLAQLTGGQYNFYGSVPYRLCPDRYHKSPHALWGTLPSAFTDPVPPSSKHPLLNRLVSGQTDARIRNSLTELVYVVDTDLRKQQEADRITTAVFPHKLPGLTVISGVGLSRIQEVSAARPPLPSPMDWRHLLATSSFRAPLSPVLLLLLLDPYPTKQLRTALHSLFLSLFTDSRFRSRFAAAIGVAYRPLTTLFCAGVGTEADTPLHFTVQILTAGSLVRALGNGPATALLLVDDNPHASPEELQLQSQAGIGVFCSPIAHTIVRCIHTNLLGATKEVNMILNNTGRDDDSQDGAARTNNDSLLPALTYVAGEHPLMTPLPAAPDDGFLDSRSTRHKRLPHLLRDLEYVVETPSTSLRLLLPQTFPSASLASRDDILAFASVYARMLRLGQGMDPQKRKISGGHVEYEQNRWLEAFGLSLNFAGTRDALSESPISTSNVALLTSTGDPDGVRDALGNLIAAILREIKFWLYREGMLETGLVLPSHGPMELAQAEALQRSTLHVSRSRFDDDDPDSSNSGGALTVALACATGIKMTEAQLILLENALRAEDAERLHLALTRGAAAPSRASTGATAPVMGDWLRVPHSPLAGDSLSFHLPLHRALAKCVKSLCGMVAPISKRQANPGGWWKLPVLDSVLEPESNSKQHPLVPLIRSTLRSSNCRVVWTAGPDCSAQEAQRRRNRSRTVSANIAVAKIIHSIADHPVRCIAAAQQIERHLWARNGSSVAGMAMNYASTPLCRSFRDLDILMVQLSASGMSCGLGARRVFGLLLSRFSMEGYLCDPERRSQGVLSSGSSSYGATPWINPPRLQDPDHAIVLSESFFLTLCVLVSELPPPPPTSPEDDSSLRQVIRRELIHALAAEHRSHSEAMTAASVGISRREETDGGSTSTGAVAFRTVFTQVLGEVANQKTQRLSRTITGPPVFELKPTCCDEYDPTFFHLRRHEHQHAMDVVSRLRKQNLNLLKDSGERVCVPLVCQPPRAHPRFMPCRLLLHLPSMDAALRRSLLFALTGGSWLPPPEPLAEDYKGTLDEDMVAVSSSTVQSPSGDVPVSTFARRLLHTRSPSGTPFNMPRRTSSGVDTAPFSREVVAASSVSFLEVLQLLTLQVHTLEECAALHRSLPDLDEESRALSSTLSINSYLSRLIMVPESLIDCWALKPFPEGPLSSRGSGDKRGSVLGLLIALYEHRADHAALLDADGGGDGVDEGHGGARALASSGLKWLLRFVNALVDGAPSVSAATKSATSGIPIQQPSSPSSLGDLGCSSWTIDDETRSTIRGMLAHLPELWPEERPKASPGEVSSTKSKEAGKAHQMRVLEMMKLKQQRFASTIDPLEAGGSTEVAETDGDLCIICRCDDADGENNGPLGYLGHVQRSRGAQMRALTEGLSSEGPISRLYRAFRVVGHMGCQLRETEAMESKALACLPKGSVVTVLKSKAHDKYDVQSRRVYVRHVKKDPETLKEIFVEGWASVQSSQGYVILSPLSSLCYNNTSWGGTRPMIRHCGHAAHVKCVETHTLSLHQRAAGEQPYDGRFAANIADGEFLCPLCKQLSNILIPRDVFKGTRSQSPVVRTSVRPLHALFSGERLRNISESDFTGMTRRALKDFGSHLYNAMNVPWEKSSRRKKQMYWHHGIQRWDFEDDDDASPFLSTGVKDILRLLRQQLIAWASIGHSAASAEAGARGIEEVLPFGVMSHTSDPWISYNEGSKASHPALLELKRSLTAACGLLEVLCLELKEASSFVQSQEETFFVGACLADLLEGRSWLSHRDRGESRDLQLWTELTALMSCMPCHVSRDGVLPHRCEARATASAMWALKGVGSSHGNRGVPPTPLAVNRLIDAGRPSIPGDWGTMSPFVNVSGNDSIIRIPFRPGIASSYLYKPLLLWDLSTLSAAVLSSVLANNAEELPSTEEILQLGQLLVVARIIQVLVTPYGFEVPDEMDLDLDDFWSDEESMKQGEAILKLFSRCRGFMNDVDKSSLIEVTRGLTDLSTNALLAGVGQAVLPFSRALILMLRACVSAIQDRQSSDMNSSEASTPADDVLTSLVLNGELMTCDDGFHVVKAIKAPMPSELLESSTWMARIDRWLDSAVGFEAHHGSAGRSVLPTTVAAVSGQAMPAETKTVESVLVASSMSRERVESAGSGESDEMEVEDAENDRDRNEMFVLDTMEDDAESLSEIADEDEEFDEAEEMVDFPGALGVGAGIVASVFGASPTSALSDGQDTDDDSSSGTDGDNRSPDREFAHLSRSPVLPYQPCILGTQKIGPGGMSQFDYSAASAVMADLSHLGTIHRKDKPTFCLIRLPKSFVELYNLVNKVKGREDSTAGEDNDDAGSSETAICLLTGKVMRSGSSRRGFSSGRSRPPGACTLHARKHGSGIGIFFLIQKCTVLLMHNDKSAYSPSIYVDEHGEEDPGLRRGRPLMLNDARYRSLEALWRQQGIPREVAQIRSTSDRVIRDNWY